MAEYVSLITGVVTDCQIVLTDATDYTNDSPGHASGAFDYSFIEVKRPVDNNIYRLQSDAANDGSGDVVAEINPPSVSANQNFSIPTSWAIVNGVYDVLMIQVPTYNNTIEYAASVVVFYSNKIYVSNGEIPVPANDPANNTTDWTEITLEDLRTNEAYVSYRSVVQVGLSCIVENTIPFVSTLMDDEQSNDVLLSSQAGKLAFVIHSNFESNDENGHAISEFTVYRKLRLTRQDGSSYTFFSLAGGDALIAAPSSGNTILEYNFISSDVDGVWKIELWEYPTWQTETYYNSFTYSRNVIVYYGGKLWKALVASLNVTPEEGAYWTEVLDEEHDGRYYYVTMIGIRHIRWVPGYDKIIAKSACAIIHNPCDDKQICGNKDFMRAVKIDILMKAFELAMCHRDFKRAKEYANALNQLIDCC